ncbi:MAG: C40 family peptidase [Melioribacteraceae bacterium]|nr:C40 family peptidase [Melioribacteraceae bacterium]
MIIKNSLLNNLLFVGLVFGIIVGCSPATNAQRYGSKKSKPKQTASSIRYQKSNQINKDSTITPNISALPDTTFDEFDEVPPTENVVDKKKFLANYKNYINPDIPQSFREEVLLEIIRYIDTPYKYGGNSEDGIDCSGFTKNVFSSAVNIELPRSAREQYQVGDKVEQEDLEFGDLVFFNTTKRSFPGHVGLYIGDNQFIHASRKLGVTISSFDEAYYSKRFVGARRIEMLEDF